MWGALAVALLDAACTSDSNDVKREDSTNQVAIAQWNHDRDIKIRKEETKQELIREIFTTIRTFSESSGDASEDDVVYY